MYLFILADDKGFQIEQIEVSQTEFETTLFISKNGKLWKMNSQASYGTWIYFQEVKEYMEL